MRSGWNAAVFQLVEMTSPPWTLRLLTDEHFDEARELLLDAFTSREPITFALGASRDDTSDTYPRGEMLGLLQYPLSVVAVAENNEVVGVLFVDGKFPSPVGTGGPEWMAGPWNALHDSLIDMSEFQISPPNKLADGIGVAVKKDWGGKGIGTALMTESVRLAKEHGYSFLLLMLTSKYSLKIALKLGFQLKAFKKYKEIEYKAKKPFISVDPEHEGVGFAVLDLEKYDHKHENNGE